MERTDELLVKLPSILKRSDAKLDTLAGKLVEITEKFDIWNSQLKIHYRIMQLRAFQLKNLVAELEKTDTVLEIRAVKIVERTEALEIQRSKLENHCEEMDSIVAVLKKHTAELEVHSSEMERRDEMLEEQVAKLVEQTEAFQKPSRRGLEDEPCHTVTIGDELHGPQIAQDTKPTISPSQQGNPQQDQEEPVSVLSENPAVL
ncbi:protein CIP2A-like isoform X2 [Coturnix japonica]|uniref:protein CIP2A-like isoform X2 n=1 Tax=Coturnix japonica TaxID=93934 RepID=UPI0013A5D426|nr:protein CIP2A-like isoform X2 [Coturnix japonica]